MTEMRRIMEMISNPDRDSPVLQRDNLEPVLRMMDKILGNQLLSKHERAKIFDEIAGTASRMADNLRRWAD